VRLNINAITQPVMFVATAVAFCCCAGG